MDGIRRRSTQKNDDCVEGSFSRARFFVSVLFLFLSASALFSVTTNWTGGGANWNDPFNWDNGVPTGVDDAVIPNVGIQPVMNVNGTTNNLTIQTGATLDVNGRVLTINLTLDIQGTGILYRFGTGGEDVTQTDTNSGTVEYRNPAGGTVKSDYGTPDYYNLVINGGTSASPYFVTAATTLSVANNLTIQNAEYLDIQTNDLSVTGTFNIVNGGFLFRSGGGETAPTDTNSGTVRYNNAAGGTIVEYGATDYYNLEIDGGTLGSPYFVTAATTL